MLDPALATVIEEHLGLRLGPERWPALKLHLERLRAAPAQLVEAVRLGRPEDPLFRRLVDGLVVGETHFFRDPSQYQALRTRILPDLRRSGQPLKVLCAACSTGEEAYTLSILLQECGMPQRIVAGDISPLSLEQARRASYREWSLRGVDEALRRRYFRQDGEDYHLVPEVRDRVDFVHLNLARDLPFSNFDLILCRHVLIYFPPARQAELVGRLRRALRPGGWLLVGPSESCPQLFEDFELEHREGAILFRKPGPKPEEPALVCAPSSAPHVPLPEPDLESIRQVTDLRHAERMCRAYLYRHPRDARAHALLGDILAGSGENRAAADSWQEAIGLDPGLLLPLLNLALHDQRQGQRVRARRQLSRLVRLLEERNGEEQLAEADGQTVGRVLSVARDCLGRLSG